MNIVLMLKQHVGAPCKAIVDAGDHVKKGQLVAEPQGLGANIHSSVYGVVESVDEMQIIIKADDEQPEEYVKLKKTDDYLELIREAGIVGAGGAGFPTAIKYKTDLKGGCVIANAAECEPILDHNTKMMELHPEYVVEGLKYVMEITNADKGYIAIKPVHKKACIAMGRACKNEPNIEVKFLPNMYPAGDERVIVREIMGVELEPGQLPLEANAVISNVETLKNVYFAIKDRKPVITKDVTVGGRVVDAIEGKVFFDQPLGMPVGHYIETAGGYIEPHGEIVIGGPFTGKKGEESTPLTKTSGGILVAMPFPQETRKVGILECECGANEARLREIAEEMGAEVVSTAKCKRMVEVNGRYRCDKPGCCPGQAETILGLRKEGAEVVLTATCQD
jgi:proline reductase-associated electron transfer protein PrdC